jgi:hypothetical protein
MMALLSERQPRSADRASSDLPGNLPLTHQGGGGLRPVITEVVRRAISSPKLSGVNLFAVDCSPPEH